LLTVGSQESQEPIVFMEVLAAAPLLEPYYIGLQGQVRKAAGHWSELSRFVIEQCVAKEVVSRQTVAQFIQACSARYRVEVDLAQPQRLAAHLVPAHATLILSGSWKSFAFPFSVGRRGRGMRFSLARPLLGGVNPTRAHIGVDHFAAGLSLDSDILQSIADSMRVSMHGLGPEAVRSRIGGQIAWLSNLRDNIVRQRVLQTQQSYSMTLLMEALIFGGFLHSGDNLRDALESAIKVGIPEKPLSDFLTRRLMEKHAVPSRARLHFHRSTAFVGDCVYQQSLNAMAAGQGQIMWGTLDSSPLGSYDWLLHGLSSMRESGLVEALRCANALWSGGLDDNVAASHMQLLRRALLLEQQVPGAVGSGRATLRHKMHVVCQVARMVTPSWKAAAKRVSSVFSWTGDLGVESGVSSFYDSLISMFGPWLRVADSGGVLPEEPGEDEDEEIGFDFQPEQAAALGDNLPQVGDDDDAYIVDCRPSIYVPGLLHIIHNCTKDFGMVLTHWQQFEEQLRHVARLLSKKHSKTRLLRSCFVDGPQRFFVKDILAFNFPVYSGRWGTAMAAVTALLPLQRPLQHAWSLARYSAGGGQEEGNNDHSVKAEIADAGISSPMFWGYMTMIDRVAEFMLALSSWAEGCACHHEAPELQATQKSYHISQSFPNRRLPSQDNASSRASGR
jgi:hypothetical protein